MSEGIARSPWRIGLLLATVLFVASSAAPAKATLLPDCNNAWLEIDTLQVNDVDLAPLLNTSANESDSDWVVIIVRYSNGDSAILIDPYTIRFSGPCPGLDTIGLPRVFDFIASESVRLAAETGLIGTSNDPAIPASIDVYVPTCVTVLGSGATTTYASIYECDQAVRDFAYSTPGGVYQGTIESVSGDLTCGSGVETVATGVELE